jgi:hypothetical protein
MANRRSKEDINKKTIRGSIFSPNPENNSINECESLLRRSYTDFNLTVCPISADSLLERWSYDRSEVSSRISSDHITSIFQDVFPLDRNCKGCLGEGVTPYVIRSSCIGCQLLTRLFIAGKEGHTRSLKLQAGKEQGKDLYISYIPSSLDSLTGYTETKIPKEYGSKILSSLDKMLSCEKGFPSRVNTTSTFCTTSRLSNYIIISCMIEAEMKAADMPGLPLFRWVYECKNGAIMVESDIPNRGNLKNILEYPDFSLPCKKDFLDRNKILRADVTRLILSQIIMNLAFLSNYDFTHGEPCMFHILIVNEPCSMKYDNIRLESPFTIHIVPTSSSGMTINNSGNLIRTYCSDNFKPKTADIRLVSQIKFISHLRKSDIITPCSPVKRCNSAKINPTLMEFKKVRVMSYKINDGDIFDTYTNNLGVALFPSSFDAYAFFLALMVETPFSESVLKDANLSKIWKNLWIEDEYTNLMLDLVMLNKFFINTGISPTYIMLRNVLVKYYLRCDGLYYIWEALKTLSSIV